MQSKQIKNELEQNKYINTLYSIVDKLEQRIATLEKVIGKLQLRFVKNKVQRA